MRLFVILFATVLTAAPAVALDVSFGTPAPAVAVYDIAEIPVAIKGLPAGANPFTDLTLTAVVTPPDGKPYTVAGFIDAADGSAAKFRIMPSRPGRHTVKMSVKDATGAITGELAFTATESKRRGPVRIDPKHPHHFVWEGTGEHYFWNGTTTYWLLGVQDDKRIEAAIDRLAKLKVSRLRVALNARTKDGGRWFEPQVTNTDVFRFRIDPWPAKNPADFANPQFDTARYDVAFWQKADRLVKAARDRDVVVSLIFFLDGQDKGVDPFAAGDKKFMGSDAEAAYYRYAAARLSAFSNVMWDITNEWHLFRNVEWVNKTGTILRDADPVKHLTSVHGRGDFPFYKSPWADFAMYQVWDEAGAYPFLRKARKLAADAGRPMPQINEEYGYEDHYPGPWGGGRKAPARAADTRRKLAWEMSMAGGYQTTGERADEPGQGGWITGLGNDKMVMPKGYAHMVDFFTSFEWWKCDPVDGMADAGVMVLADAERNTVAVYAPKGGYVKVKVPPFGVWKSKNYDPRTGKWGTPGTVKADDTGAGVVFPDGDDWAVLLTK